MQLSPETLVALDRRISACAALPLQVRDTRGRWLIDPFSGDPVLLNPARRGRPQGAGGGGHDLCEGRTTPTLLYVPRRTEAGLGVVVEEETASLEHIRRLSAGPSPAPPAALVTALGAVTRTDAAGVPGPVTLPAEPWLARGFLNLVPAVSESETGANSFVIGVPPQLHELELALPAGGPAADAVERVMPVEGLEAVLQVWLALEAWAGYRSLIPVPFINGGRSRLSGQSIPCFHAQLAALPPDRVPPSYEMIQLRRAAGECPLCALLGDDGLRAATVGRMAVIVHPAPRRDLTLLVVPEYEAGALEELETTGELAEALIRAVRMYELLLGGLPAYVLALRTGPFVGHLHAEIVLRSGVNVPAGFDETSGISLITRDPYAVAAVLRERVGPDR